MSEDPTLNRLLQNNAQWAEDVAKAEPSFFQQSAQGQSPKVSPRLPLPAPQSVLRARSLPPFLPWSVRGGSTWRRTRGRTG